MSSKPRGRGRCAVCDRVFTLTSAATVPGHTRAGVAGVQSCEGGTKAPKAGSVTSR